MFSTKNSKEISLIADIGSASVAIGLVYLYGDKQPEVIFSKRLNLDIEKNWNKEKTLVSVTETLYKALDIVLKESAKRLHVQEKDLKNKKIKDVFCVLSSPLSSFKVKTLKNDKEKPEKITEELINSIIKDDLKSSYQDKQKLIEQKIIQTRLNGYPTQNPLDKKARKIEISIFEGLANKEAMDKFQNTIEKIMHGNIVFHSLSLVTIIAINEIFKKEDNFLIVDITGETTELVFVENDLPYFSFSFTGGKNDFIRNTAEEFATESDIAMSFIKLYYEKRSENNFYNKAEKIMKQTEENWISNFKNGLLETKKDLPNRVFFIVDPKMSYPFPKMINSIYQEMSKEASVTYLGEKGLSHFSKFKDSYDPFLSLESISINKMKKG